MGAKGRPHALPVKEYAAGGDKHTRPDERGPRRRPKENVTEEHGRTQARVRVKVKLVTPSSLVTVMFSFRLPKMVLTIYRPRPTPSRSMLLE